MPSARELRWVKPKRMRSSASSASGSNDDVSGIEMTEFYSNVCTLQIQNCTYNLRNSADRATLAADMWSSSNSLVGGSTLLDSNKELKGVFEVIIRGKYSSSLVAKAAEDGGGLFMMKRIARLEILLSNLARMKSQNEMPLLTARISLAAYRAQLPTDLWKLIHAVAPGLLASHNFVESLLPICTDTRPPPQDAVLEKVGAAMFDNYTRRILYSSTATTESHGFLLNMTNSCSMLIPQKLAGPQFDAAALCERPRSCPPLPPPPWLVYCETYLIR